MFYSNTKINITNKKIMTSNILIRSVYRFFGSNKKGLHFFFTVLITVGFLDVDACLCFSPGWEEEVLAGSGSSSLRVPSSQTRQSSSCGPPAVGT